MEGAQLSYTALVHTLTLPPSQARLEGAQPSGGSDMYNAISKAHQLLDGPGSSSSCQKLIILISDDFTCE